MLDRNVYTEYEHAYANAMYSLFENSPKQKISDTVPVFYMLPRAPGHLQHCIICVVDAPSCLVQHCER